MARVTLELPERFPFRTEIPVRVDDLNYGNHVGNDSILTLAQEARMRYVRALGFPGELDVGGLGVIMVDALVVYRSEARYGMTLAVDVAPADLHARGFDLLYRISDAQSGKEVARVKTGLLFFDYAARKVAHVPDVFRRAVGAAPAAG